MDSLLGAFVQIFAVKQVNDFFYPKGLIQALRKRAPMSVYDRNNWEMRLFLQSFCRNVLMNGPLKMVAGHSVIDVYPFITTRNMFFVRPILLIFLYQSLFLFQNRIVLPVVFKFHRVFSLRLRKS